ncbi:hypothetical protein GIB67_034249 [Kingdonia uniflora]|uniref:beta-glucosidase n=1 Tax=Kingdonia uniflora TaxID=39325 RepID=A0A7J7NRL9_9MAGN|nr:hypothetical protein GIB67_034249 [Kingdonia uniflora]
MDVSVSTITISYWSWNGETMHANHDLITGYLKKIAVLGVGAGIDMIMVSFNYTEFIDILIFQVKKSIIPMSRIDDAGRRILRVKFIMGLYEHPLADLNLVDQLGSKNGKYANKPLLLLAKNASKILVAGSHADNLETFGNNLNLAISEPGPSTIKNVCGSVKCVVIVVSGRPCCASAVYTIDALVAAWLSGTEGQGVADVLLGDYRFTGKVARTWFITVDQLPMNFGDTL